LVRDIGILCIVFTGLLILGFSAEVSVGTRGQATLLYSAGKQSTDICFACHEDHDLTMEKNGKQISLYVDPKGYQKSVHGGGECTDCHRGYNPDEIPHTKTKAEVNCQTCHEPDANLKKSVHASANCYACHSKHDIKPAKELSSEQSSKCYSCHGSRKIQKYKTSIHAKKNIGCESCHQGGHSIRKISKSNVALVCGKCHGSHERNYDNSIHQTIFKKGGNAPTCTDCHGSHEILTSKMTIESQGCLKCHLDEKLFPGDKIGSAKFVAKYKTSIHASIEKNGIEAAGCVDCHGNHLIQNPDNPMASTTRTQLPETCGKCHHDVVDKFLNSAHGKSLLNKNVAAPTCVSCHSEHSIEAVKQSDDFSKINQVELCLKCHLEGKLPHRNYKGEEVLITQYKNSYHYQALKEGKLNAATCSDCHGSHEMARFDDPNSRIYKKNISKTCGQSGCHVKQFGEYNESIHGVALETRGNFDAPTCTDCHGMHQILRKDEQTNRISNPKGLVQLCSSCHSSVEIVERYNLPVGRTETYMSSFHGLATRGGSKVAANCESCHGHHNIKPSSDTSSSINKKNLPKTCGKCHPGVDAAFFTSPIHVTDEYHESPWLFWVGKIYLVLILLTIGGMATHNAIDFFKKIKKSKSRKVEKFEGQKAEGEESGAMPPQGSG
jgi:predicted CXXCH cytochrome family protein